MIIKVTKGVETNANANKKSGKSEKKRRKSSDAETLTGSPTKTMW